MALVSLDGLVRRVNDAFARMLSVAPADVVSRPYRALIAEDADRHMADVERTVARGAPNYAGEARHRTGDEQLRALAELLRGRLRNTDVVARIGGDEFAVLLPETDIEEAEAVADDLLAAVAARPAGDAPRTGVTAAARRAAA